MWHKYLPEAPYSLVVVAQRKKEQDELQQDLKKQFGNPARLDGVLLVGGKPE